MPFPIWKQVSMSAVSGQKNHLLTHIRCMSRHISVRYLSYSQRHLNYDFIDHVSTTSVGNMPPEFLTS